MIELIQKGGVVMWPIAALGLITVAIFIERAVFFIITSANYNEYRTALLSHIDNSGLDTDLDLVPEQTSSGTLSRVSLISLRWKRSAYHRLARVFQKHLTSGEKSMDEALARTGGQSIEKMERFMTALSAISHVSPLLGLLGTVTGIISSFAVISELGGQVDVTALAGGIWEAMLTTASGLVVAIPAQLAYFGFEKIIDSRSRRMGYIVTDLKERMYNQNKESA